MLKKIGTSARLQMEHMLGTKVFLELYVKAEPGWRDSRRFVEELDWRRQLEHRMFELKTVQPDVQLSKIGDDDRNHTKD
jgi:GTP-binding protein Era